MHSHIKVSTAVVIAVSVQLQAGTFRELDADDRPGRPAGETICYVNFFVGKAGNEKKTPGYKFPYFQ